jgi:ATP-dependent DNA ligase
MQCDKQRLYSITSSAAKTTEACGTRFVIDGDAVILGVDGASDFDALQRQAQR